MPDNTIEKQTSNSNVKLVRKFGMEMHNPVFFLSAVLILLFSLLTLIFPEGANQALNGAKAWTLQKFDWFYAITPILILVLCIGIAISPFGKIRLGGKDAKPEYSVWSWIAMLFAAGVGVYLPGLFMRLSGSHSLSLLIIAVCRLRYARLFILCSEREYGDGLDISLTSLLLCQRSLGSPARSV